MTSLTADQKIIRDILIGCARRRNTITYGELGEKIGRPAQGPWKKDLNAIRDEEVKAGRLDLTWVVVLKATGRPRRYNEENLDPKDKTKVQNYLRDLERVYECWK